METPDDTPDDVATPTGRTSRPSRRSITIGAGVALAALAAVATVGYLTRGDADSAAPDASATADPTQDYGDRLVNDAWTVDWNATFDPAADVVPLLSAQAPASFDDGLSDADLGERAPRNSPRFPPSYVATDAIWDQVGEGWGVAAFGASGGDYVHQYAGFLEVDTEFYLVSPEGHYFRLWSAAPEEDYGRNPTYTITGVYPNFGWITLSGYWARAESETGGFHEVRDLRTGEVLSRGTTGGEGDEHYGTARTVVGPLEDGSWFWADVTNNDDGSTYGSATLVDSEGRSAPLALPDDDLYGARFTRVDDAGTRIALSNGSEFRDHYYLYLYDVSTGVWTDATDLTIGPDGTCPFLLPNDDTSFYAYCGENYDLTLIGYDGSMTPATEGAMWKSYSATGWDGNGFEPTLTDPGDWWGDIVSFRDVSSGTPKEVLTDAQCGSDLGLPIDPPVNLGRDRYAFRCETTNLLAGYDRSTGETFALAPAVFPDTGARSGLAGFVAFPTETTGPSDTAAATRVGEPGATAAPGPGIVLLSAHLGTVAAPGSVAAVASDGYPDSTPYTPEILDQVSDLWRIESYGPSSEYDEGATSVYLTSPEGTRHLVLTLEGQVTPLVWDHATQRVLLSVGYGDPPEVLDLATGALIAPYGDADADAAFRDGSLTPVGLRSDGRYYWFAPAETTSTDGDGVVVLAWSGVGGREVVATLPSVTYDNYMYDTYGPDFLSPDGKYLVYQTETWGQASWVDLTDPARTGTIGTHTEDGRCYLDEWISPTTIAYGCGTWDEDIATRVWDISQGKDVGPVPPSASVPTGELAAIYDSFQLPGTPLVIHTDGRSGTIVSAGVLTTEGLVEFADLSGFEPFVLGEVEELRKGTYLIHEGESGSYGDYGDRTIVVDVVAGIVLTPDLPPLPGPGYSRDITSSVLVYLANA